MSIPPDRFAHGGEHAARHSETRPEGSLEGCGLFQSVAAELALGSLTGPERSAALAHLDDCDDCRTLLEDLSVTADALLLAAPEADPPAGFEVRLLARLGYSEPAAAPSRTRRASVIPLRRRARAMLAAAAVAVAFAGAGIGVGLAVAPHQPAQTALTQIRVATLRAAGSSYAEGKPVGEVAIASGNPSWVVMTFQKPGWSGWVSCVVSENGRAKVLGTFFLRDGSGSWAVPLATSGASVSSAQLRGTNGAVFATAQFST
jgi:hypothetical protein